MIELGEKVDLYVTVWHKPDFDYACDLAQSMTVSKLRIDEDGHSDYVKDWKRSENCIKVEFITVEMVGGMNGWDCIYHFRCWAE